MKKEFTPFEPRITPDMDQKQVENIKYRFKMAKRKVGRPPKYETAEEMQEIIDDYFLQCVYENQVPTVGMLAQRLGMDRKSLDRYKKRDKFSRTVKEARQRISDYKEDALINNPGKVTGLIFDMKNNEGYTDKDIHDIKEAKEKLKQQKIVTKHLEDKYESERRWKETRADVQEAKASEINGKQNVNSKQDVIINIPSVEDLLNEE